MDSIYTEKVETLALMLFMFVNALSTHKPDWYLSLSENEIEGTRFMQDAWYRVFAIYHDAHSTDWSKIPTEVFNDLGADVLQKYNELLERYR